MSALLKGLSSVLATNLIKFESLFISNRTLQFSVKSVSAPKNYFRLGQPAFSFHSSVSRRGLEEFFDDKKNWGELEVKVGRSWRVDELRIKSNEDLHKLWYVLLKEKNMLLTMEHASQEECRLFPNPERIDKVEESMNNLERVVRERNRAYFLLETGETGERPCSRVTDPLGRSYTMQYTEHFVPIYMNRRASKKHVHRGAAVVRFRRQMKEKAFLEKKRYYNRVRNHVCQLLRRFPELDEEAIQQQYPEVNLTRLRRMKYSRGHHLYNEG
ncbi:39S ribosomal protein L47, mitochondrial [Halocaridina rubra]|uniref:Large ribosomal subunit protein uL29m n=1 Tax=Halocaridina rubra TaxID=373956 RepID=A0AAN8WTW0_HALRR